ncbi:MAG: polyprenyl synthetase family protein [Longimicrobiales bacterium]|nr:polyprenyl synthetase family protein [Longimicrobiales bacterium]
MIGCDGSEFDLKAYLEAEGRAVEAALERAACVFGEHLTSESAAAARHGMLSGGKRLRPILCVTAWRACRDGAGTHPLPDALHDLAVGLEVIHAYSLIHDDLPSMDNAMLRRGAPTTHRVHGVDAATLGGVAMIPLAARGVLEAGETLGLSPDVTAECARILLGAAGAGGMVGGQGLDLLGEGRTLGESELSELHRHKTGALLTAALEVGAVAAGAAPEVREALRSYGEQIGLAFQIADDVLDATATAEELGKRPSDDELDKSTYVALHGLEGARRRARDEVEGARAALDAVGLESPALHAIADYIVTRRR